jgi:hypothetical protein
LMLAPRDQINYLKEDRQELLSNILVSGSVYYNFTPMDQILIQWIPYTIYQITSKKLNMDRWFMFPYTKNTEIVPIDIHNTSFTKNILDIYLNSLWDRQTEYIFFDQSNVTNSEGINTSWNDKKITYTITNQNSYFVDFGPILKSIVVRIPNLPWREIKGLDWQEITVFHGIYETIINATGRVQIVYQRSTIIIVSYILSIVSLVMFLGFWWKKRDR